MVGRSHKEYPHFNSFMIRNHRFNWASLVYWTILSKPNQFNTRTELPRYMLLGRTRFIEMSHVYSNNHRLTLLAWLSGTMRSWTPSGKPKMFNKNQQQQLQLFANSKGLLKKNYFSELIICKPSEWILCSLAMASLGRFLPFIWGALNWRNSSWCPHLVSSSLWIKDWTKHCSLLVYYTLT